MVRLKVITLLILKVVYKVFQFRYGTIKSDGTQYEFKPRLSFNSAMVRLKETIQLVHRHIKRSFNSAMVRLKDIMFCRDRIQPVCFNSAMVRLKAAGSYAELYKQYSFNSAMVRLKGRIGLVLRYS